MYIGASGWVLDLCQVSWGLWCFSQSISESNIKLLAGEFKKKTRSKGMDFSDAKFVEWPNKTFNAYYQGFLAIFHHRFEP